MKIPAKGFTHGGKFHADDVFSTALLQILRPDIQIIRGFTVPDDFDGIVVLPAYMPWKNGLYKTDALFVVYPSQRGGYSAQCVNDHRTKRSKLPFPPAWAGRPEEELRRVSGLGLRFCHPSRFLITADDKATAIEACRRTLRAAGRPVSE